eukprot:6490312-Amphidinium_carterae.3
MYARKRLESLEKQRSRLVGNDSSFVIELAFVQQMSGELGKKCLQDLCMQCLPSPERSITPPICQQRIVEITKSELWHYVEKTAHGEVEKVKKWVDNVSGGFAPKPPAAHSSEFLLRAWNTLAYFARETKRQKVKTSEGAEEMQDTVVFGTQALEIMFKACKKKGDK